MTATNDNARTTEPVTQASTAKSPWRLAPGFVALGAFLGLVLLSGCSSARGGGEFEPGQYNPATGYPAIGGGAPYHM